MWNIKKEMGIVKTEQAKGLTLDRRRRKKKKKKKDDDDDDDDDDDSVNVQFRFESFP
jgi:hypothetical protein